MTPASQNSSILRTSLWRSISMRSSNQSVIANDCVKESQCDNFREIKYMKHYFA